MTTVSSDIGSPPKGPDKKPGRGRRRSAGGLALGVSPSPWRGGIEAARRHTAMVRLLRGLAVAACVVAVALVLGGVFFAPSQKHGGELSADRIGIDGTRVTLEAPKISGFQIDRRPYAIKARTGMQDLTRPHLIELTDIDAGIGSGEDELLRVLASRAEYDSLKDQVLLNGNVRITNTSGYDLSLQSARIDFKAGTLASDAPVSVRLEGATVEADRMRIDERGHVVSFDGRVKSAIESGSAERTGRATASDGAQ